MLEKDGEDQLDRSCEKWRSVTWVNEQRNILHEISKRKFNWIGHILRRNCFLKQVIEGKIKGEMEVARRRGRRRKKLLDDLKDRRGYSRLKEEVLDRTIWRHCFGGGFGPVVRQNTEWMNILHCRHQYFSRHVYKMSVIKLLKPRDYFFYQQV